MASRQDHKERRGPLIRCKFYTNDGIPDPGCKKSWCTFIHPNDSAWHAATLAKDRTRGNVPSHRWDEVRNEPNRKPARTASNQIPLGPRSWSSLPSNNENVSLPSSSSSHKKESKPSTSDFPTWSKTADDSKTEIEKGWGSGAFSSAWDASPVSTWGTRPSEVVRKTSLSGWGSSLPPTPSPAPPPSAPPPSASPPPANPVPPPPTWSSTAASLSLSQKDKKDTPTPSATVNLPLNRPKPITIPLPGRKLSKLMHAGDVHDAALRISTKVPALSPRSPGNESQPVTPTTPFDPKDYSGPAGRALLYNKLIRTIQSLISLYLDLKDAAAACASNKNAVESKFNKHAQLQSAQKLNIQNKEYETRFNNLKRRFDRELTSVVTLPSLQPMSSMTPPNDIKAKVLNYMDELKAWSSELEGMQRAIEEEEARKRELKGQALLVAENIDVEFPSYAARLKQKESLTWAELDDALNNLEHRLSMLHEKVYSEMYLQMDLSEEETLLVDLPKQMEGIFVGTEIELPNLEYSSAISEDVKMDVDAVQKNLEFGANELAELLLKGSQLDEEIKQVEQECKMLDNFYAEAMVRLEDFKKWEIEDTLKVQELADEASRLYHQQEEQKMAQEVRVAEISRQRIDYLLVKIAPIILGFIKEEVVSVGEALKTQSLHAHQTLHNTMEKLLEKPLKATDEIISLGALVVTDVGS